MKMKSNFVKFFKGFSYAWNGIVYAVKSQINFRFHLIAVIWVLLLSAFYNFSDVEYAILFLTFATVIVSETINTAIEKNVDLCTKDINPTAKIAKDVSAGAVLVSSIFAVVIAFFLFWDSTIFAEILAQFTSNPFYGIATVVLALISFIFIFKGI